MGRYRKIDSRIQNDAKFRALTDGAKFLFLILLTHPHMTSLGAMRGTAQGLAAERGWPVEKLQAAFDEILAQQMAEYDAEASLIVLPNFLRYNEPQNPNAIKGWASALELLPESPLLQKVIARSAAFCQTLTEVFMEALPEPFRNHCQMVPKSKHKPSRKGSPNGSGTVAEPIRVQEQEQEQEKEQEQEIQGEGSALTLGQFANVKLRPADQEKLVGQLGAVLTAELIERLSEYIESKGVKYKSHYATLLAWARRNGNGNGTHPGYRQDSRLTLTQRARPYTPKAR